MSEPRDHHTIPHFYLAGFTPLESKNDFLWETNLKTKTQERKKPAVTSVIRDFYRIDLEGFDPNEVERQIKTVEDEASSIIRTIRSTKRLPEGEELAMLLEFVGLMAVRVPAFAEILQRMWEWVHEGMTAQILSSEENWRNTLLAMKAQGVDLPIEVSEATAKESYTALKAMFENKEYTLKWKTGWHIGDMLKSWHTIADLLGKRKWLLIVSDKETGEFICTDRPVALMFTDDEVPPGMSPGFGLTNTRALFPLNRRMLLLGQFDFARNGTEGATPELVAVANSAQLNYKRNFVYSCRKDFTLLGADGKPHTFPFP